MYSRYHYDVETVHLNSWFWAVLFTYILLTITRRKRETDTTLGRVMKLEFVDEHR